MVKLLFVFGTRPEAIKMAPVISEFSKHENIFQIKVCVTGQHREMLDQVLDFFDIIPDYDLNVMKPNQDLCELTSNIIIGIGDILNMYKPNYVFVHGDTTTTMAASLASFYFGSKICHIEAGLRTNLRRAPFPEEMNRQITSRLCNYHFAPTKNSKENLIMENISSSDIIVTGNTVIDALLQSVKKVNQTPTNVVANFIELFLDKDIILVTIHRRENHGGGIVNICKALKTIAVENPKLIIVFPVHLNPNIQSPVKDILSDIPNVHLVKPLMYQDFIWMMNRSKIIITDSGGVQEEAPSLGKPVLVVRDITERPEALEAGTVILVGSNEKLIVKETMDLLNDKLRFEYMSRLHNPYGDGNASSKIVHFMLQLEEVEKKVN